MAQPTAARDSAPLGPGIPPGAPPPAQPSDAAACALLRALARWPSAINASELRALASKIDDWDALLDLAQGHRVGPALFLCLAGLEILVPEPANRKLLAEYERNLLHNLASAAELVSLLALFDQAGIRALPFKGVVLAATAWGGLSSRPGGDLDFLIAEKDIDQAARLLSEREYHLQATLEPESSEDESETHEYAFGRPSDGLSVELRWQLDMIYGKFGRDLGLDWVWPHRASASVAGASVPTLSSEAALLVLCMHGCKHGWSRLVWIMDVARMVDASADLDWGLMMREARRVGLGRALTLGMLLANQVAGAALPPGPLARFAADGAALRLAQHFAQNLFRAPGMGPEGLLPYNLQILDSRDRLRFLGSLRFLRPNDRDRAVISLPRSLRALYYLIRPFRILFDRSAR
jgi:hypothetical protein